ncbi:hypothetical protein SALBM311S_13003 [Streptomyces alboniger]
MAGVLSEVLGRPVQAGVRLPSRGAEGEADRFGATEAWAQGYADMVDAQNDQGFYGASQPTTPDLAPTTFRQWCEEVLKPAVLQFRN